MSLKTRTFNPSELVTLMDESHRGYQDIRQQGDQLTFLGDGTSLAVQGLDSGTYGFTDHAFTQLCFKAGCKQSKFVGRLPVNLQSDIFNYVYRNMERNRADLLFRTDNEGVRAVLSGGYSIMDNKPMLEALDRVLPNVGVVPFSVTYSPDKFYFKLLTPNTKEIAGETFKGGVLIANSEIGDHAVSVVPFYYRSICSNGMIFGFQAEEYQYHQWHRGVPTEIIYDNMIVAISKAFNADGYLAERIIWAKATSISDLDRVLDRFILRGFIGRKELEDFKTRINNEAQNEGHSNITVFNLVNAVTRKSEEVESQNRMLVLQRLGGNLIAGLAA